MRRALRTLLLAAVAALVANCSACTEETEDCPSGQERCSGFCRDPASYATDPENCGACGVSCRPGTCAAGACQCGGLTLCATQNPRCVDTAVDPLNCGACGNDCPKANEGCAGGVCQCLPPFPDDCGTLCTDLRTDDANCSACGNACPLANDVCVAGTCTCPTGTTACPASTPVACVDLQTDDANCGACDNACPLANDLCEGGACGCPEALPDPCPTACVNQDTDESNCGACGSACASGASCETGLCTCPPAAPVACGGTGAGGRCCAGNGCCAGNTCQTQHTNGVGVPGLGQSFYDCVPLGTYDLTQAEKAAAAWQPSGVEIPGATFLCPTCIGWQTPPGTSPAYCGTWCYSGVLAGRAALVQSLVCACPLAGTTNWN